jgi:hypothetical protein
MNLAWNKRALNGSDGTRAFLTYSGVENSMRISIMQRGVRDDPLVHEPSEQY